MRPSLLAALASFALGIAGTAEAACPDQRASCVLHEEAVGLLMAGKFAEAAQKFSASLAAEPTARSYLGYAQSVEGLGQTALAFDAMLLAQKYSAVEVSASGGRDVDVNARAERIKYKLAELRSKVAFMWLLVPDGVPPARVVSVQRRGEGDLPAPLARWVTVMPGQELVAGLDDGSRIVIPAAPAPGSQQVVVIPIPTRTAAVQPRPVVQLAPTGKPLVGLYSKKPPPPSGPAVSTLGAEFAMALPNVGNVDAGYGFGAIYERYVGDQLGITGRADLLFHPEHSYDVPDSTFSAYELLLTAGARSTPRRTYHGSLELGATIYSQHAEVQAPAGSFDQPTTEDYAQAYPVIILGGGLRLGNMHVQANLLWAINLGADIDIPLRFMMTFGFDSVRR